MKDQLRVASKYAAAAVDVLTPSQRGVAVLIYHRVGSGTGMSVDLPAELFEAQIAALAREHRVVTLDAALEQLDSPHVADTDAVAITFDDGTVDWPETVLPILARYGVPATFYVATDFVERSVPFPHDGKPVSWSGLQDMLATGLATIGSHTHTHALLDRVSDTTAEDELARSQALIEDRLGVPAQHFAYPKALLGSPGAEAAVRRRFRSAALGGTRANRYWRTDPYRLARAPIQVADGMRWFRRKANGGMYFEERARQLVNRRRYANATT